MCGIVGYCGAGNQDNLKSLSKLLHHRGPDDEGFYFDELVGLAHRRLSIIDLSPLGHQPMSSEDDSLQIIFNGEIYNYQALKNELLATGRHQFKSHSDTEVILHLYEDLGTACFAKLNGMFALAIWDKNKQELILARDRVGEKPLYYAEINNVFYFSSELKVFPSIAGFTKKLNHQVFLKYLDQGYCPGPNTIFESVQKLGAGEFLVYKNNQIKIEKYWTLPTLADKSALTFSEAVSQLDNLIDEAVKIRLMSDVPLGVFLSGGLDSSLVAYYAQNNSSQKIKTFTISFGEKSFDESPHAAEVAKLLNTDHHVAQVSAAELLSTIDGLPSILDEPLADSSIIPTYWLSKKTRASVTVALGGDAGDELFFGYQTFKAWRYWQILRSQPAFIRQSLKSLVNILPSRSGYFSADFKFKRAILNFDADFYNQHFRWFSPFTLGELGELVKSPDTLDYHHSWPAEDYSKSLNQSAALYQKYYLTDDIFTKVDRASMAVSLETRAPLVDYRLIEFANSLPPDFKFHHGQGKYILKKLAEKYLPENIIYREKHGFPSPVDAWLRGPLKSRAEELFSGEKIIKQALLNPEFVQFLWQDFLSGNHYRARQIWPLFIWQLWAEKYL
ncbi:asparagine synthase (glutamine-hydrolyzing) [Candidatus Kuenenbacteria bacterium]|nr:asparagine synthase (glutamine-hydrolyzing) [Candidatus Kuenenbacteria bacterium]